MIFILSWDFGGLIQKGGSLACTITSNDTRPPPGKFQSWCTVAEAMSHRYLWVSNYKEGQTEQVSGWHYEPGLDWFALRVVLTWFSFGCSHSNRPQQNKHPINPRSMYWPNLTIIMWSLITFPSLRAPCYYHWAPQSLWDANNIGSKKLLQNKQKELLHQELCFPSLVTSTKLFTINYNAVRFVQDKVLIHIVSQI